MPSGRAAACPGLPVAGHAQVDSREGIALQNQIYQLKQDLQLLRCEIARGSPGGGGGGGSDDRGRDLLSRVQAMEEQVRQLRGRIDETQNLITRQNADLSKRIDDLTFQLNLQQGRGGSSAPPASAQGPPRRRCARSRRGRRPNAVRRIPSAEHDPGAIAHGDPAAAPAAAELHVQPDAGADAGNAAAAGAAGASTRYLKTSGRRSHRMSNAPPAQVAAAQIPPGGKRTPELALQEGHAALARRDYAAAERAAREVMANRASPRAYDGQLLLAQALAGEKQFAQAAIAFDDTYNRSHKGRHAQDALVGLAGALTAINEKKAACDTLGRLRTEFPEVRADLKDTITRTNDRAGCAR